MKTKVWVSRDESDEVRVHMNKPYWVNGQHNDGYFYSEGRNWQLENDSFTSVTKGETKCVDMFYSF